LTQDAIAVGPSSDCIDIEAFRVRLRRMTDTELLLFGKDNRYMCSPYANVGKPPLEAFVIQLREARAVAGLSRR